jgi:NADH dehydrogenase
MSAPETATAIATTSAAPSPAPTPRPINKKNPHIVILGGGFGGLNLAKALRNCPGRITLIDRQNHHLFQPLLYQVATASLSSVEIAKPLRSILSDHENLQVELGDVQSVDLKGRVVHMHHHSVEYDYLVLAMGGVTSYFGHPEWAQFAPGLKSITDAMHIRREILYSFEKAELTTDPVKLKELMTIVIVGGGPTGVELAGAAKELGRFVMRHDFRKIDPTAIRVVLVEAADRILMHLPKDLSASAQRQLEAIGVEVRLNTMVQDIKEHTVIVKDKAKAEPETFNAASIVWAAGVGANPITRTLGVDIDRAGRIKVNPDCSVPGYPEAFAIGDIAFLVNQKTGTPVPGVSPAAIQMGQFVAKVIEADIADPNLKPEQRLHFHYWDKGTMATIGHARAVAMIGGIKFSGFLAWLAWLGVHILFLVGFTNKLTVVIRWVWAFFTRRQGARVFTSDEGRGPVQVTTSPSTSMVMPPATTD